MIEEEVVYEQHQIFLDLCFPPETLEVVFRYLPGIDLARASGVCKQWYEIVRQHKVWNDLYFKINNQPPSKLEEYEARDKVYTLMNSKQVCPLCFSKSLHLARLIDENENVKSITMCFTCWTEKYQSALYLKSIQLIEKLLENSLIPIVKQLQVTAPLIQSTSFANIGFEPVSRVEKLSLYRNSTTGTLYTLFLVALQLLRGSKLKELQGIPQNNKQSFVLSTVLPALSVPLTELPESERKAKQWIHICQFDQLLRTRDWLLSIRESKEKKFGDYAMLERHYYAIFCLLFIIHHGEETE